MIRVRYLRSFDKSFKNLPSKEQNQVEQSVDRLLDYFSGKPRPSGLGLRKLKSSFWEIRASLDKRILFTLEGDLLTFVFIGNHDELSRQSRMRLKDICAMGVDPGGPAARNHDSILYGWPK